MGLASNLEDKFLNQQLEIVRQMRIIEPDEEILAMVALFKRSQLVMLLGLLARFLQERFQLIVTNRRVILIRVPAFLVHGSGYYQHVSINGPCQLRLPCAPKAQYQLGVKVILPDAFAAFVGRPFAYVVFGLAAETAFARAAK